MGVLESLEVPVDACSAGIPTWLVAAVIHLLYRLAALQHKDDKKKDGKKDAGGAPDKAQRARTFLEAEFDDAVNALKQQVRCSTDRLSIEDIAEIQQMAFLTGSVPAPACTTTLLVNARGSRWGVQQREH